MSSHDCKLLSFSIILSKYLPLKFNETEKIQTTINHILGYIFIYNPLDMEGNLYSLLLSLALCFHHRCLQNYIPPQSLTLSCPVCRQTSILPEKGVAALQNNFFITNLMEVLQREQDCTRPEASSGLESAGAATYAPPLSCPNHEGKVSMHTYGLMN